MQFLDKTKIKIISGKGGNGMVAWRREKYVDKGGPAGGDGGRGGDVYLVATENMSTLMDFKFKSVFRAENGENGGIKNMHGRCAKDLFIHVPVGTVVKDIKSQKAGEADAATQDLQLRKNERRNFANPANLLLKENLNLN